MKTEKEKMQAGETYYAFDPELMELHRDCLKWVEEYNRTYFRDYTQGGELLRKFLPNAHPSSVIQAPFWCDFGFNIYGGENGFINYNCTILDTARIYLGKNILIGPNVQLYAPMHPIDYRERATGAEHGEPITIGDDCWIGGGAVICPGVTIGKSCPNHSEIGLIKGKSGLEGEHLLNMKIRIRFVVIFFFSEVRFIIGI